MSVPEPTEKLKTRKAKRTEVRRRAFRASLLLS